MANFGAPDAFPAWQQLRQLSYTNAGFTTGHPMVDMGIMMMMGQNLASRPAPNSTQSIYDSYLMRERNMQFMQARNAAFANNMLFQKIGGVNQNSMPFQALAMFAADPDGPLMRGMSPFLGGNPVKAQMGMFANMTGMSMSAFGQAGAGNLTVGQSSDLMNELSSSFYTQRRIKQADIDKSMSEVNRLIPTGAAGATPYWNTLRQAAGAQDTKRLDALAEKTYAAQLVSQAGDRGGIAEFKKAGEEFIKTVTNPAARRELQASFDAAIKDGTKTGMEKFARETGAGAGAGEAMRLARKHSLYKGDEIEGFNFAASRGFKLEDLTQGYTTAAQYQMLGRGTVRGSMTDFMKGAPGVMDAARGIWGSDKGGGELMGLINQFMGRGGNVNLRDAGSSEKLENLLRDVKSAARTAGVSIESIMGIIEQGRALAEQHGGTRFMSGQNLGNVAIQATAGAATMMNNMSDPMIRMMGGAVGITSTLNARGISNMQQSITQNTAALMSYFSDNPNAQAEIKAYAAGEGQYAGANFRNRNTGFKNFVATLAAKTGVNQGNLFSAMRTTPELMRNLALNENPELANVANLEYEANVESDITIASRRNRAGGLKVREMIKEGNIEGAIKAFQKLNPTAAAAESFSRWATTGGLMNKALRSNPHYAAMAKGITDKIKDDREMEKTMSKKYAHLAAPVVTDMFNEFISGNIGREGIGRILNPILAEGGNEFAALRGVRDQMGAMASTAQWTNKNSETYVGNIISKGWSTEDYNNLIGGGALDRMTEFGEKGMTGQWLSNQAGLTVTEQQANIDELVRKNPKLAGLTPADLTRYNDILTKSGVKGVPGKLTKEAFLGGARKGLIDKWKEEYIKVPTAQYKKNLTGWVNKTRDQGGQGRTDMNTMLGILGSDTDFAELGATSAGFTGANMEKWTDAMKEKFKTKALAAGVAAPAVSAFMTQVDATKGKIDDVRTRVEAAARGTPEQQSLDLLKKIAAAIGAEGGGDNLVTVLGGLSEAVSSLGVP